MVAKRYCFSATIYCKMLNGMTKMRFKSLRLILSIGWILSLGMFVSVASAQKPIESKAVSGEIVAYFPERMSVREVEQSVKDAGCEIITSIAYSPGYYRVGVIGRSVSDEPLVPSKEMLASITKLRAKADVLADPNYVRSYSRQKADSVCAEFTPKDPEYGKQFWHYSMISLPQAWGLLPAIKGKPVVAAVIDSGIDPNHPDLKAQILPESISTNGGRLGQIIGDSVGHGTHVSGTVAANTNNAVGVSGVAGYVTGGTNVKLLAVQTDLTDASLILALNYVTRQKAVVVNASWGGYGKSDSLEAAITSAIAANVTVVAAAGNDSIDSADLPAGIDNYPADYPGVIKVSALGPTKRLSTYSNYGGPVAIAAPGGDSFLRGQVTDGIYSTLPTTGSQMGRNYGYSDGTSMAAPHVTGVCALLVAAGVPATPAALKVALQESADPLDEVPNNDGGNQYGAGALNAYRALAPLASPFISVKTLGDNGASYFGRLPFQVDMVALAKMAPLANAGEVKIVFEKIGSSATTVTYVAGTDFDVPAAVPGVFCVTQNIPRAGVPLKNLTPGLWKVSAFVGANNITSTSFLEVKSKSFAKGLHLISLPFKASSMLDAAAKPETSLLGNGNFSLYRYNPYRGTNDKDYAQFISNNGSITDTAARLSVVAPSGSPIAYEIFSPSVSVAPLGLGYWLNVGDASDQSSVNLQTSVLQSPGLDATKTPVALDSVAIHLSEANSTWNMIGNPFLFPVSWSSVTVVADGLNYTIAEAIKAKILGSALVGYGINGYEYSIGGSGTLEPFKGYWVSAKRPCTLIVPPSIADTTRRVTVPTSRIEGWKMRLVARVGKEADASNYFGQQSGAQVGEDEYDISKPPASPGGAYMRFIGQTSEGKTRGYASDMKPLVTNSGTMEWTVAVTATHSDREVSLSWEGLGALPRRSSLTLKDMATGKVIPMSSRSGYTFASGEAGTTRRFLITLTPQFSTGPLAVTNVRVASVTRVQGSGAGVSVRFMTTQESEVVGVVKTITGQTIGRLSGASRAMAGADSVLRWDGRNQQGAQVPAGPYVIEVQAKGATGESVSFQRTIQNVR
jgi:subtilisin family serine protease